MNRHVGDLAPLQLYSSAIIFAPQASIVRRVCGRLPDWVLQRPITPRVWSQELQQLEGHTDYVTAVAFSPDGSLLASASWDKTVRLWQVSTGQQVQQLEEPRTVTEIKFTANGQSLLTNHGHILIPPFDTIQRDQQSTSNHLVLSDEWVSYGKKKILWLPQEYRSALTSFYQNQIAFGHDSGRVTFLKIQP